ASAGWKATSSPGLNFVRATLSIGALRSVAVRCTPGGRKLRNWRVTIPVPEAVSSTRAGLQAARDVDGIVDENHGSQTAVVVLRDIPMKLAASLSMASPPLCRL